MSIFPDGPDGASRSIAIACRQAELAQSFHRRHCRFLRFIDTHQKWLLLHLIADTCASAGACRGQKGAAANWIIERAAELEIASRNTTLAFFAQLPAYGYVERQDCRADRRIKLVSLSPGVEAILADWAGMIAASLSPDEAEPQEATLWLLYLDIAHALLDSPKYLVPPCDVRLTQEMRGGWLIMSHILTLLDPLDANCEEIPVPEFNAPHCARAYGLSRSTLYRLLRLGAEAGIMGWRTEAQIPLFWISRYHLKQYCRWNQRVLDAAELTLGADRRFPAAVPSNSVEIPYRNIPDISATATSFV
jgi:hypothetical protein